MKQAENRQRSTARDEMNGEKRKRVVINVSGRMFETWEGNLSKHPNTLLGSDEKEFYYNANKKEYFFDRDPNLFRFILNYYRFGRLHFSVDHCADDFKDELSFFGISINAVDACCWEDYRQPTRVRLDKVFKMEDPINEASHSENSWRWRKKIWNIFEHPERSLAGVLWYYFSGLVIALSIACTVAETIPPPCDEEFFCSEHVTCASHYGNRSSVVTHTAESAECKNFRTYVRDKKFTFFVLEAISVACFSLEYIGRLLTAPKVCQFVRGFMALIDLFSVLPFYVTLLLEHVFSYDATSLNALVLLRILRIFRVLKFSRHSSRLRSLLTAIRRSASELGFIVFSFSLGVVLVSSLLYFIEKDKNSQFNSIPATMWYSVVTMTTTGYGDLVPTTPLGQLVGSVGCIIGVLMIALPVPVIQKKANLQLGLLDEVDQAAMET